MKKIYRGLAFLMAVWAAPLPADEVTIGVLAHTGKARTLAMWQPTAAYLEEQIPDHRFEILPLEHDEFAPLLAAGKLQFVLTNPLYYIDLESRHGVTRIATLKKRLGDVGSTRFGSVLFVRTDRDDLQAIEDLRGRSIVGVDETAFGGWLMAARELRHRGFDLQEDFAAIRFTGLPHNQVVQEVLNGRADAGVVRTGILERLVAEGEVGERLLRVLEPREDGFPHVHTTPLYPEWPFANTRDTEETLSQQVAVALLSLPAGHPAAVAAQSTGWTTPLDYQPVDALMRDLEVGAYARLDDMGLSQALLKLWPWLLATLLLVFILSTLVVAGKNRALKRLKSELASTLRAIGDGVVRVDHHGRIDYMNAVAERIAGQGMADCQGRHFTEVFTLADVKSGAVDEGLLRKCLFGSECDAIVRVEGRGSAFTARLRSARVGPVGQAGGGTVLVLHDISELHQLNEELSYQASHDPLTGLLNRIGLERLLQELIDRDGLAVHVFIYIDLDDFKIVNDTCGHDAGDELLTQLSTHLKTHLRTSDYMARLGGDEFGVVLPDCPLEKGEEIAEKLRKGIESYRFHWGDKVFRVGGSLGLVAQDADVMDMTEMLRAADAACYVAKDLGRNRVHVYKPDDADVASSHGQMSWISRITRALDEDRFELFVQKARPVKAGDPAYVEVLLRLRDVDGTRVSPGAFIPAAERYHMMEVLDRRVVEQVLANRDRLLSGRDYCAVNLSGQSLGSAPFRRFLEESVEGLERADLLCFEITETAAVANMEQARTLVENLRRKGCRFALDDFGSGLSSFAYLKHLPVDFIKIDGSFIRNMVDDELDQAMVTSIAHMSEVLGIKTVAEYVEDEATIDCLQEIGVDYLQGFGIEKPRPLRGASET